MPQTISSSRPTPKPTQSAAPVAPKAPVQESSAPKSTGTTDKVEKPTKEEPPRSGFSSFMSGLGSTLGKVKGATSGLEFSDAEKEQGLKASDTMDRLAGPDGKWDKNDLANNFAQLPKGKGLVGRVKTNVARSRLFEQHQVPKSEQDAIVAQSEQIRKDNPDIGKMRKLEGYDQSKFNDKQQAKYDDYHGKIAPGLEEKGLMPISISQLQDMGGASEGLQDKLSARGLSSPEPGAAVDAKQYRGLFEGKSPLRTQLGF